jgi:hypothetical protein
MSEATAAVQSSTLGLHPLEEYEPLVGAAATSEYSKKLTLYARCILSISARRFTAAA